MDSSRASTKSRERTDRRTFTWRTVVYGFIRSRRRAHRRSDDSEVIFLDWHHPWLFFLATGTMLLSCADAFFTLELINRGMIEANPVMQALLQHSTGLFAGTKLAMTAAGVFVLVYLAKSRFLNRVRTGAILTVLFGCYACLVCYEVVTLFGMM